MIATIQIEPAGPEDLSSVRTLLTSNGLPEAGFYDQVDELLVARAGGEVIGSVALELYGDAALLRSLAVRETRRGEGLGEALTEAALALAAERGIRSVYLLTTTAEGFFPRFGFAITTRNEVPTDVRQSVEITTACPASATVMTRTL